MTRSKTEGQKLKAKVKAYADRNGQDKLTQLLDKLPSESLERLAGILKKGSGK